MTARRDLKDATWDAAGRLGKALSDREEATKAIKTEMAEVADYLAMLDALGESGNERGLAATKLNEARKVLGHE